MSAQPESPLAAVWGGMSKIVTRLMAVEARCANSETVNELTRRLNEAERRLNDLERSSAQARGARL